MLIALVVVSIFLLVVSVVACTVFYATKQDNLSKKRALNNLRKELTNFQEQHNNLVHYKGRFVQLEKDYKNLINELESLKKENKDLFFKNSEIEKIKELLKQEKKILEKEKETWGKDKQNLLKKLSLDLIKQNSEFVSKRNKEILEQFESVTNKVSSLDDAGKKREKTLDTMRRALLNPGGAGLVSETTLANILKASGLRQKQNKEDSGDYILQTSFNTQSQDPTKRPDAIIYLPNNNYIIIDSKSSSHFMDLQNAVNEKNEEKKKQLLKKIKDRMNTHLENLKSKDYQKAQLKYLAKNDEKIPPTVMTVMFLQTEQMLDTMRKIDKNFELKCYKQGIPAVTPIGLINLLNVAKYSIYKEKQDKNINKLKEETRKLLSNIFNMFKSTDDLGKGLKKALQSYDAFVNIFNRNILTRAKNIEKLGIESKKQIPGRLERYELSTTTIEGETLNES